MRQHWSSSFFGHLYGQLYSRHLLAPSRTSSEAKFAQEVLKLQGRQVLDLAAGFGRHARLFARHCGVFALDLNRDYLKMARRGLPERIAPNLRPLCADMRSLPFRKESFDAVLLLFNSFGYFLPARPPIPGECKDPNCAVLKEVARVLLPKGDFLIELPNQAALVDAVTESPRRHLVTAQYEIEEEFAYDSKARVLHNRTAFRAGRRAEEVGYSLRLYDRTELTTLLKASSLRVVKCYGDYSGSAFKPRTSELLLVHARKSLRG